MSLAIAAPGRALPPDRAIAKNYDQYLRLVEWIIEHMRHHGDWDINNLLASRGALVGRCILNKTVRGLQNHLLNHLDYDLSVNFTKASSFVLKWLEWCCKDVLTIRNKDTSIAVDGHGMKLWIGNGERGELDCFFKSASEEVRGVVQEVKEAAEVVEEDGMYLASMWGRPGFLDSEAARRMAKRLEKPFGVLKEGHEGRLSLVGEVREEMEGIEEGIEECKLEEGMEGVLAMEGMI